ncbi:MAG: winged helix-turn-helix transcriptional regulator [Myxococcota bacterium]
MPRISFDDMNCAIARSMEALGDGWTMLIIRDAFFGVRRFADFERNLGISKNVLTARLRQLVEHEVLERTDRGVHGERYEYSLTPKGEALLPVLTALREWGDAWVFGEGNEPYIVRDRATGERPEPLAVRAGDGRVLGRRDLRGEAGPGADERTRRTFPPRSMPGS